MKKAKLWELLILLAVQKITMIALNSAHPMTNVAASHMMRNLSYVCNFQLVKVLTIAA